MPNLNLRVRSRGNPTTISWAPRSSPATSNGYFICTSCELNPGAHVGGISAPPMRLCAAMKASMAATKSAIIAIALAG
jgi:hypothetical protein